tara:strand:- start:467 stop:949 length:483 start_codon:yes stop_codon:yes gene_type:complete
MKKINKFLTLSFLILSIISCSEDEDNTNTNEADYTIWNGNNISFEKADGANPSDAANQDRVTELVWITRGNDGGQIYNIAKENSADKNKSPIGTQWAVGTIQQIDQLSFDDFRSAVGYPKEVVGKNLVLHLVDDNIYLSVKFTSWSSGNKGGFSYERSTP